MIQPTSPIKQNENVATDMETMHAAVCKAQEASLARGVAICFEIDGVLHYKLPSGEVTRECPWPARQPDEKG